MKKKQKSSKVEHEIVVRVEPAPVVTAADLAPIETNGGKYMIPKTWMSERQVLKLVQKTPTNCIYTRPAKGGGTWQYVTGHYVERVLNFTFGWNWDFEVQSHGKEGSQVWVLGKLTVKDDKGHQITKTQFGRADCKMKRDTKEHLDFGNDLKAATTDALKKCASLLGIASDIYGKAEYKQETGKDVPDVAPEHKIVSEARIEAVEGQVIGPDGKPTWVCEKDGDPISTQVADYSLKMFGKRLCREHQPKKK